MFAICVSNICLVLYNGDIGFDVVIINEDVNIKLYISSVCQKSNLGDANLCQNSGFLNIFTILLFRNSI